MTDDASAIMRDGMCKTLREVADLCGMDCACELVRVFGGVRLWVPMHLSAGHILNRLGESHAIALVRAFGHSSLDVPRQLLTAAGRALVIDRLTRDGLSQGEIAILVGLSQRSVSRAQNGHLAARPPRLRRVDPRQIDLEDWLK